MRATLLLIDNYDSFTYNLRDYLLQLDCEVLTVRNDEGTLDELPLDRVDGIVVSPGPKRPADAGWLMPLLERVHTDIPVLGICLGHQALGELFGAELVRARLPVHGKTAQIHHERHPIFHNIPRSFRVMRYHSLILENIPASELEVCARTTDGEIMAVAHRRFPCVGVQFHPESVLSEHGLLLLDNWVEYGVLGRRVGGLAG